MTLSLARGAQHPRLKPDKQPLLSVLIPAYNRPQGVERALASLAAALSRADVEVVVSDDSTDDQAAARIAAICARTGAVRYTRNQPPLGAVPNWNHLLDDAAGEYCLLLHHDEELSADLELPSMLEEMAQGTGPDCWVLACSVVRRPGAQPVRHFPVAFALWLVRRWPGYLMRRNLLGSPSVLVAKRSCWPRFDSRLQWRVDVDAYLRLALRPVEWRPWRRGGLLSHLDTQNSITAQLASRLVQVEEAERSILATAHKQVPGVHFWLGQTRLDRGVRAAEMVLWGAFRLVTRGLQKLRVTR